MTPCQMVLIFGPTLNFSHFYAHSRHFTLLLGVPRSLKAFLCLLGAIFSETEIPMVLIFSFFFMSWGESQPTLVVILWIFWFFNVMIPLASFYTFWTFLVSFISEYFNQGSWYSLGSSQSTLGLMDVTIWAIF